MRVRVGLMGLAVAGGLLASAGQAQFSDSFKFLKAVKERDGSTVSDELNRPNSTAVNTRDDDGSTPLHIVTRRRDTTWMEFLLAKGAKPELRDKEGNTPLAVAAAIGFPEGIDMLAPRGSVNTPNNRGETPLILAVHNHDLRSVHLLLTYGANPNLVDHIAGKSARDYASDDPRNAAILRVIQESKVQPSKPVAGPPL